jgi:hypothetical protein
MTFIKALKYMTNLRMQDYFPFLLKGERPGSVTDKVARCCNCTFLLKGGRPGWGWNLIMLNFGFYSLCLEGGGMMLLVSNVVLMIAATVKLN